ncbi:MAG: glycosyltransferase family 9 protein [Bdellovibrionales bacterium]|nr:glycosyltransferase family 9 protein [Bdellovibrionales bacterium]
MAEVHCKYFSGYKPCGLSDKCDASCAHRKIPNSRILIIHLGAMGAVARATSIIPAIRRKYPMAHISWVTESSCLPLLENIDGLDQVYGFDFKSILTLSALEFDVVFNIEKSVLSGGILRQINYKKLFGFRIDSRSGSVLPANDSAMPLWELGLSNHKKFYENQKAETQLLIESLELGPFQRDPYQLRLSPQEKEQSRKRRFYWAPRNEVIIGINTGCAPTIPYKKISVPSQKALIQELLRWGNVSVVLLGGPQDTERNIEIAKGMDAIVSPTTGGLRDGMASIDACDIVISGDSLGMHLAIGLGKWVVAWFGPTCEQEIDLYDRGMKIKSSMPCSPCWKRVCDKTPMCHETVPQRELILGVKKGLEYLGRSSEFSYNASI